MTEPDRTMRCPSCSEEILPWETACAACGFEVEGEKLAKHEASDICHKCGAAIREGMIRCRECGEQIAQTPAASEKPLQGTAIEESDVSSETVGADDDETTGEVATSARRWPKLSIQQIRVLVGIIAVTSMIAGVSRWAMSREERRPPEFRNALKSPVGTLTTILYTNDGKRIAAGSTSGNVVIWDLESQNPTTLSKQSDGSIITLALVPGELLAAADENNTVFGWKIDDGQPLTLPELNSPATAIIFRLSESTKLEIILGTAKGELLFVNPKGRGKRKSKHTGGIKTAVYLPERDLLVTGGNDGRVAWMKAESRVTSNIEKAHNAEVDALAVSPDGKKIASGDWNGKIVIWDIESQKIISEFSQPDAVSCMAFRGNHLVTGSWDGRLRFWSVTQKSMVKEIHTGKAIFDLAVSPDGNTIATVSSREQIDLWNVLSF